MRKHIIAKLERSSNLRKSIRGERELFNAALSNVEFPATNIPYSPAMYSDILFDSRSFVRNACASPEGDNNNDVMDDSSSMRVDKEDNGKERENLVVTEMLNDEASEEENDKTLPFPEQLMNLLSAKRFKHIIDWLPHGQSLLVCDKKKFNETVLPIYFKKTKYASFTRKLNRWGFKRICKGVDTGAYSNEYFKRDDPNLCKQMKCKKKYEIKKKISNPAYDVHYDINPDDKKKAQTVIDVMDKAQASVETTVMNAAPFPEVLVRNPNMCPERHEKIQEINSFVKAHASINITDMDNAPSPRLLVKNLSMCSERYEKVKTAANSCHETQASSDTNDVNIAPSAELFTRNQWNEYNFMKITPSPRLLNRNQSMCSERYVKMQETENSFHKVKASSDTTDVNITPTVEHFTRNQWNQYNFMNIASSRILVRNKNMCSERYVKMQETENSFHKAQVSSDTADVNITPTAELFTRNQSNFTNISPLPSVLVRKLNLCSEHCEKMQGTETSFYNGQVSSDTTDMNITPVAQLFTRNKLNFMKLLELKKQQKEIDNMLEDIIQGTSNQIRYPIQPYLSSFEEKSASPKLYRNYASSA